jgi:hypothetical protein
MSNVKPWDMVNGAPRSTAEEAERRFENLQRLSRDCRTDIHLQEMWLFYVYEN